MVLSVSHELSCVCCIQLMADAAYPACILETRKTAPGLRLVDKWAVRSTLLPCSFFTFFSNITLSLQNIKKFCFSLGTDWWRKKSQDGII